MKTEKYCIHCEYTHSGPCDMSSRIAASRRRMRLKQTRDDREDNHLHLQRFF